MEGGGAINSKTFQNKVDTRWLIKIEAEENFSYELRTILFLPGP